MDHKKVVTRFAPSPTGFMHIGGVRTALFAWAYARKHKGTFILRIEDTDKNREVPGSIEHIIKSLAWLNISWDEGVDIGGPNAPYLQSERLLSYKKYAQKLADAGHAYMDPYSEAEVEAFRQQAALENKPFLFRNHRPENPPAWDGSKPLRLKTPVKSYSWHDEVRGDLSAGEEAVDDFILIKGDGYPTYNFAHIIDDFEMGVTHVMRGDEFISSTPKFLALYEALGIEHPLFVTLPPIMAPDGKKKLGKRDGAKDILEYQTEGYLPEAMINFLAFIGWNPGDEREIFSPEEFVAAFDLSKVQRSGGGFNIEKLNWINKEHMKLLSYEKQEEYIADWLPESIKKNPAFSTDKLHQLVPVIMERIEKFSDIPNLAAAGEFDFFFSAPSIDPEKLLFKGSSAADTKVHLSEVRKILSGISTDDWSVETIKARVMSYADGLEKRGPALHPLRYALSGKERSPDPFTIASIIGLEETTRRIDTAEQAIS